MVMVMVCTAGSIGCICPDARPLLYIDNARPFLFLFLFPFPFLFVLGWLVFNLCMGEKESMLDKMKNAKSFLDTPNKQAKKKEVFAAQLVDTLEEAQTPLLAETPPADSTLLFSETATLFKRKDSEWSKVSSGKIVGKEEPGQGVQILFFMENTRMALNTLHTEKDKITLNGAHLVLVATEEKEASVVCFLFKNESTAKKVHAGIEESKADKMSPPGIEPGTSSV